MHTDPFEALPPLCPVHAVKPQYAAPAEACTCTRAELLEIAEVRR